MIAFSPALAHADSSTVRDDWTVLSHALWGVTEARCPVAAQAYSDVFNPDAVFQGALELDFGNLAFIPGMGIVELNEAEKQFLATVIIGSSGVIDQLVYQNFFGADQTGTDEGEELDILGARERATASLSLMDCMWPTNRDLEALAESRGDFVSSAREIMKGTCEIQFFTLYQRFLSVPVETLPSEELSRHGEDILEEHEEFLDAYLASNDCEDFG